MSNNIHYKGRIYIDYEVHVPDPISKEFEVYISTLVSYPYIGTNLKDGQVVVDNTDYELKHEYYTGFPPYAQWETCTKEDYRKYDESDKRIIAIPKEQPTEHHRENCPCEICSTIRSAERRDPSNAPDLKKEETQNELWQEVIRMPEPIGTLESLISVFSSKFTITRK